VEKQLINERWLITFADLMSILFALFVLINSFSEIDAETFKKNALPMSQAFNGNLQSSDITYEGAEKVEKEKIVVKEVIKKESIQTLDVVEETSNDPYLLLIKQTKISDLLNIQLKEKIENDNWNIHIKDDNVFVVMSGDSTFNSGSSDLSNKAKNGLDQIIDVLPFISGEIVIVGHTDDIPIQSFQFPSNWALSSSRASAVASYIILNSNINKTRISVVGKAETEPISTSKEENRRIELKIKVRPN
jgi:chemotaxis protein MotB